MHNVYSLRCSLTQLNDHWRYTRYQTRAEKLSVNRAQTVQLKLNDYSCPKTLIPESTSTILFFVKWHGKGFTLKFSSCCHCYDLRQDVRRGRYIVEPQFFQAHAFIFRQLLVSNACNYQSHSYFVDYPVLVSSPSFPHTSTRSS